MKYYIDTCIWIDFLDDRRGYNDEPLGEYAEEFIHTILQNKDTIIISGILIKELSQYFILDLLDKMFIVQFVKETKDQVYRAKQLAKMHSIPLNDALHAIISKDNGAVLVSRDKHFNGVIDYMKPEEL